MKHRVKIYQELHGVVIHNGVSYKYKGRERDWNCLGQSVEQNRAMGHLFVITLVKQPRLVASGDTLHKATKSLEKLLEIYFDRKRNEGI